MDLSAYLSFFVFFKFIFIFVPYTGQSAFELKLHVVHLVSYFFGVFGCSLFAISASFPRLLPQRLTTAPFRAPQHPQLSGWGWRACTGKETNKSTFMRLKKKRPIKSKTIQGPREKSWLQGHRTHAVKRTQNRTQALQIQLFSSYR